MSLQNRQLRSTSQPQSFQQTAKGVKASPQTRQVHNRHDTQAKELSQFLSTWSVRLQDPQTKKWSKPGEVLSGAENSHSHVAETPKVLAKERNTRYTSRHKQSARVQEPATKTEVLRIPAKPPSLQPTSQPTDVFRVATKPSSHQHTTPTVFSIQSVRSTKEAFINVQSDVPQPQSVIKVNDKPIIPPGYGNNNKAISKASTSKPPELVKKDINNLKISSRLSKHCFTSQEHFVDILLS